MTPGQTKTARFITLWLLAFGALVGIGIAWEFHAIGLHDQATISEVVWIAWALQPGPIMLALLALAALVFPLAGHFFWQDRGKYDAIRKAAPLVAALLVLSGCATAIKVVTAPIVPIVGAVVWVQERAECGFKCPHDSSCEVYASGVFASSYACECKYPSKDASGATLMYPSKGRPCAPQPSPSPKAASCGLVGCRKNEHCAHITPDHDGCVCDAQPTLETPLAERSSCQPAAGAR